MLYVYTLCHEQKLAQICDEKRGLRKSPKTLPKTGIF